MKPKHSGNCLAKAEEEVREAHRRKEYRPTAVALIRDRQNRILLVRSAKDARSWYFPQGGIDEGESLISAFYREVREEVRIAEARLMIVRYRGSVDISAESGRRDKRGFLKGKRYFTIEAMYDGPKDLTLQTEEVDAFIWATLERVPAITLCVREAKRRFMLELLGITSDEERG